MNQEYKWENAGTISKQANVDYIHTEYVNEYQFSILALIP